MVPGLKTVNSIQVLIGYSWLIDHQQVGRLRCVITVSQFSQERTLQIYPKFWQCKENFKNKLKKQTKTKPKKPQTENQHKTCRTMTFEQMTPKWSSLTIMHSLNTKHSISAQTLYTNCQEQ